MAKTRKVMEINDGGIHLVVIKRMGDMNPFRIYHVWWNSGWHRKELERYGDMKSVTWFINDWVFRYWSERQSDKEGQE